MRTFSLVLTCGILFLCCHNSAGQRTAASIADTIILRTGNTPFTQTVDNFKAGDPQSDVKGVIICMFATMDVLKKAVEMNCNMIIAHEPVYYNGQDDVRMLETDQVFLDKKKYIDDHHLIIWRFHDYIHRMKPDGIVTGMIRELGWQDNVVSGQPNKVTIPQTTLNKLLQYLKKKFPGTVFNVVGDPDMQLTGIAFSSGASGSRQHITMLEDPGINVVIAGEVPQWETYEYVRDAVSQGKKKALILLGHIPSEDAGMEYATEWIRGFVKDIPVYFVESGPSYRTYPGGKTQ